MKLHIEISGYWTKLIASVLRAGNGKDKSKPYEVYINSLEHILQIQAKDIFEELDNILTFNRVKVKDNYDKIKSKYMEDGKL